MKKGGRKKRERFKIVLTIKRPLGEFVMVAEGYSGPTKSKYSVRMCAHVKTQKGKLRHTADADGAFLTAHMREISAMVSNSFSATDEYGRTYNWK